MNKKLTAIGVTAGLAAGGLGGLILAVPAISGAQTTSTAAADASALSAPAGTPADRPDPADHLADVLKPLVDNGTITQSQADAVAAALSADHQVHEGDHGMRGPGGPKSEVLAQALGMSDADLQTALESGKTIAQVAADQGVDVQVVIDALTAEMKNHISDEVTKGESTQAEADAKLADLSSHITDMVNNPRPAEGPGGHGGPDGERGPGGEHGPRGPRGGAPAGN
jgi:polyhydroxyalkanoate synthesis regulator phasin